MLIKRTPKESEKLLARALEIIVNAIMHGMPVTQEVADVRNEILHGKAESVKLKKEFKRQLKK